MQAPKSKPLTSFFGQKLPASIKTTIPSQKPTTKQNTRSIVSEITTDDSDDPGIKTTRSGAKFGG